MREAFFSDSSLDAAPLSCQCAVVEACIFQILLTLPWVPAPTQIGGLLTLTRTKTPYLSTYPQAARSEAKKDKNRGYLTIAGPSGAVKTGPTYLLRRSNRGQQNPYLGRSCEQNFAFVGTPVLPRGMSDCYRATLTSFELALDLTQEEKSSI